MEGLVSLPDYDVFAYLMVGVALLAASDLIFGTAILLKAKWNASNTALTVIAAYVIGQLTAFGAAAVLENQLVLSALGRPIDFLVPSNVTPDLNCIRRLMAPNSYFMPLHSNTLARIEVKNEKNERKLKSEELFWEAYNTVKQDENAFARITTFSRLYNFCRNMAFASVLAAVVVLVTRIWRGATATPPPVPALQGLPPWLSKPRWQLLAFGITSVLLYAQYLYYLRAHSIEVITTYAYGKF
jgi:hypothetical protein